MTKLIVLCMWIGMGAVNAGVLDDWQAAMLKEGIVRQVEGGGVGPSFGGQMEIYRSASSQKIYEGCSEPELISKIIKWCGSPEWGGSYLMDIVLLKNGRYALNDDDGEKMKKVTSLLEEDGLTTLGKNKNRKSSLVEDARNAKIAIDGVFNERTREGR